MRRAFDYSVPDALAPFVRAGTVVRVPLHGRSVRGWVLDPDVAPDAPGVIPPAQLRPLLAVSSDGPPADVVALCSWAAWWWAGPVVTFLRGATPPNIVLPGPSPEPEAAVYPSRLQPDHPWASDALVVPGPTADVALGPLTAPEGSTLVLAPSARDAQRIATSLRDEGRDVVRMGADRSARELTDAWCRARLGACVVVGGRTAAWAPVPDLASVIILDDLDEAFDDERAPTWSARDVAIERARRVGATVRIVSPAPSVEALVALGEPPGPTPEWTSGRTSGRRPRHGWPRVDVVDVREQEPGQALVTRELADALHQTLDAGARAVCVLNRRGRSRLLACRTCRELARCERCGAIVRDDDAALVCAVCATTRPSVCLHCHATRFRPVKPGVAHVRDDLAALLPRVEVGVVEAATDQVPDAPVLVGTEAVLHRVGPRAASPPALPIGLVAFLELDQELLAPRVRAAEQALWLLVRGARVLTPQVPAIGPADRMLVQTRMPDHEVVVAAATGDTLAVTRAERARREELGFPPFGGVAALRGEVAAVAAACDALRGARDRSDELGRVDVLGPVDGGRRALVRAPSWTALADALATPALDAAHALGRLRIDVDPRRD